MNHSMRMFIANGGPKLSEMFHYPFNTPLGWMNDILMQRFGLPPSVANMRQRTPTNHPEQFFQMLYVACWVAQPVVKGTYLIPYTNFYNPGEIWEMVNQLTSRWSTHLSGGGLEGASGYGHSASEINRPWALGVGESTFQFVQGGRELLVQNVQDAAHFRSHSEWTGDGFLMLKMEGHLAYTARHMFAAVYKVFGQGGRDFSKALKGLTSSDHGEASDLEIELHANEYNKPWNNIVAAVSGSRLTAEKAPNDVLHSRIFGPSASDTTTVATVIAAAYYILWSKGGETGKVLLTAKHSALDGMTPDEVFNHVYRSNNREKGCFLEALIEIAASNVDLSDGWRITTSRVGKILAALRNHRTGAEDVARSLKKDTGTHSRFATEIYLEVPQIDEELQSLLQILRTCGR